jgi:transposase, IS5 family
VIKMRRAQLSFGDGLIAAEVDDLCEDWMRHADQDLADELLVAAVYEALGKRFLPCGVRRRQAIISTGVGFSGAGGAAANRSRQEG